MTSLIFSTHGTGGHQLSEAGGTKTHVIGLEENAASIDELAQRVYFRGTP